MSSRRRNLTLVSVSGISFAMWAAIIYGGIIIHNALSSPDIDDISTASLR